jgi:hypothetical protein
MSLKWENCRKDAGHIYLPKIENGQSRTVGLNEKVMAVFSELSARKGMEPSTRNSIYVFPSRQGSSKHIIDGLVCRKGARRSGTEKAGTKKPNHLYWLGIGNLFLNQIPRPVRCQIALLFGGENDFIH